MIRPDHSIAVLIQDRDRSRVSGLYLGDEVDSTGEPELTLDEQMERVNINSVQSVKDFCLDGIDDYYSISKTDRSMFTNAVVAVAKDLNRFDVKKHKCALCGGSGHNFDNCPEVLKASGDLKSAYIRLRLLVNKLMSGFLKLYPSSKNQNDTQNTPVSAITTALSTDVSSDGLQGINQLLQQQQQSLSSLNNTVYNLSNVVVQGFDMGNDSDTASTGTGVDSLNSLQEFTSNFCKGKHKG